MWRGSTECYTFRASLIARITCMFPCLCAQGSSVAEYQDYGRQPVEKRHLRACVPVRLARVYTPKLHLNVVAELLGIPGVLHICEGKRSSSPVYFAFVKRTGKKNNPAARSKDSAMASLSAAMNFEHGDGDEDYFPNGNESFVTNRRHLLELQRLSAFQQVTTKVPPSYDGRSSWFAYEDAIDDWCDITELDGDKRGPALRNRLEGEAAIHKRLLDRDRLKDPNNGVKYFKSFLRPLFVKGAANVFLYRFQQFMNLHRGNGDRPRWMTRFQLSVQRMQEAWNDTYLPITDPTNEEVRAFIAGLPAEEQAAITNEEAMDRATERLRDQHARTIPITANLVALIFVSLSDLTQDQRQVLTSLMAHRNRVLADYRLNELRSSTSRSFAPQRLPSIILSWLPLVTVAERPSW